MVKKIDVKSTLKKNEAPISSLNVEQIEEMTRLIHTKQEEETNLVTTTEPTAPSVADQPKRGRKSQSAATDERLVRVSVDLPESIFIQLKVLVIQQKTDLKSYVRQLVEREITTLKN
jgi:hypothetical protein